MILNLQTRVPVNVPAARKFVATLRRSLKLGGLEFTVCLVDARTIRRLNREFRGMDRPTDVLSFPWQNGRKGGRSRGAAEGELVGYLGDVVISAAMARRQSRALGHSSQAEIHGLILHGVLHLVGYDHETDDGEMTALERALRDRLGLAGSPRKKHRREGKLVRGRAGRATVG